MNNNTCYVLKVSLILKDTYLVLYHNHQLIPWLIYNPVFLFLYLTMEIYKVVSLIFSFLFEVLYHSRSGKMVLKCGIKYTCWTAVEKLAFLDLDSGLDIFM